MIAADLERFRLKLREYRLLVNRNQAALATYLNLDYNELSNRLNAHKNLRLSHENVRGIVRALAEWGAINTRAQAEELLDLMLCPHFDSVDWQARPLSKLTVSSLSIPATLTSTPPPKPVLTPTSLEPANNLPQHLSSFIGRHKEISELKKAVGQQNGRLITLIGAGGCGKTRLSLQVATELLDSFGEGVWLVELASLSDPALVAQTIATTLGLSVQPDRPILTTLSNYLRSRRLLLVLDNCEHLVEECARLVDRLIRTCIHLYILATSREVLSISGEMTYRVPSLTLPAPQTVLELEKLADYEAVKLFIERAVVANPEFALTHQNAAAVVQICRQLDGIPLALELAAARIKVLTPEQLAGRLDDRFRLLTGGNRTALPRQQTLKALIDWSYELLNPTEKRLLAYLSVFLGGWTLRAAEAVCPGSENEDSLAPYEILEALTGLVNKSLVQLEEYKDKVEARYSFLETIRQYGLEKLKISGKEEVVRQRHVTYYSRLVEELNIKLFNQRQTEMLAQMDSELGNLRAAIEYGLRMEQAEAVFQLTFSTYWDTRGYYNEERHYLEQLLALPTSRGVNRGKALYFSGLFAMRQTDLVEEQRYFEECLAVSNECEDQELRAMALNGMGQMNYNLATQNSDQGRYVEARRYYEQSLTVCEELGGMYKPIAQHSLGFLLTEVGEYAEARRLFDEAEATARAFSIQSLLTFYLGAQSWLAMAVEDYPAAHRYLEEMQSISEEIGFHLGKIDALCWQGMVWANEARFDLARPALNESLVLCLKGGLKNPTANGLVGVARLLSRIWQQSGKISQPEKVALLCGAIKSLVGSPTSKSLILFQLFQRYYEQAQGMALATLGEAAFGEAFARGMTMSQEEAIGYARQVLAEISP